MSNKSGPKAKSEGESGAEGDVFTSPLASLEPTRIKTQPFTNDFPANSMLGK